MTKRAKYDRESKANLKKIYASRGGLTGFFYFVSDKQGKDAAVYITLRTQDKTGKTAAQVGKKLRREISGAKFSRGSVQILKNKLIFELSGGTAGKALMKTAFQTLAKRKEEPIPLLKGARFKLPGKDSASEPVDETEEELSPEAFRDTLSEEELAELAELEAEEQSLGKLNKSLNSFLSTDAILDDIADQINTQLEKVQFMLQGTPDPEALRSIQIELAEAAAIGPALPETVGETIPDEVRLVLNIAAQRAYQTIHKALIPINASLASWVARTRSGEQISPTDQILIDGQQQAAEMYLDQLRALK